MGPALLPAPRLTLLHLDLFHFFIEAHDLLSDGGGSTIGSLVAKVENFLAG